MQQPCQDNHGNRNRGMNGTTGIKHPSHGAKNLSDNQEQEKKKRQHAQDSDPLNDRQVAAPIFDSNPVGGGKLVEMFDWIFPIVGSSEPGTKPEVVADALHRSLPR